MEQLSALDTLLLNLETGSTPMHVGCLGLYDTSTVPGGDITFKSLLRNFESRLHKIPALRYRQVSVAMGFDRPYWVADPEFDIEFHIRHLALPAPGDWRQLCIQFARLHARPLDMGRPPWELYVLEGVDNVEGVAPGGVALILKIHHALLDGASGVHMLSILHDLTPEGSETAEVGPWMVDRVPTQLELLGRAGVNCVRNSWERSKVVSRYSLPIIRGLIKRTVKGCNGCALMHAPRTRFNNKVSQHRVFEAVSIDLKTLNKIRDVFPKVTVNDVIVSVVSGALRRYLIHKDELPEQSLTAMLPVNIDPSLSDVQGNNLSLMVPKIHTELEDPVDRLKAVQEAVAEAKHRHIELGRRELMDMAKLLPTTVTNLVMRSAVNYKLANHIKPLFNTVITSIKGPQEPVYHAGAKLEQFYGGGLSYDTVGLCHVVFSYDNTLTVSITCCRDMMPDPEFYAMCLERSWQELKQAALKQEVLPNQSAKPKKKAASLKKKNQKDI